MNRLYRYLLISLFALVASDAIACYDESYAPAGYYMYRVYENKQDIEIQLYPITQYPGSGLNCKSWQQLTSETIPLEDIYKVVYIMPLSEFEKIYNRPQAKYENKFVEWITKKDKAILEFLFVAKTNEYIRVQRNSRWYYPTMKIDASMTLEQIAEKSLQSKDKRLRDRYLLQAVRAYFSLNMYQQCVDIWNGEASKLPADNALRAMIQPYIAGAEFRLNNSQRAIEYFAQIGDVNSMLYCANRTGEELSTVEAIDLVYKYAPNSPYIAMTLQWYIRSLEPERGLYDEISDSRVLEQAQIRIQCVNELLPFCVAKARAGKDENTAMWYYTAAFLSDLVGQTKQADSYLRLAESCKATKYIGESIKVLRIYLDAKLSTYNSAYEAKLFEQLKWLDSKITQNITDEVEHNVANMYKMKVGESFYYWNDMMRRIVLSEVCPRMVQSGQTVRALQLANMADNRLLNLVDLVYCYYWPDNGKPIDSVRSMAEYRYDEELHNSHDYSNHFFELIDSVGVNTAVRYVNTVRKPKSEFDRYLNARGYVNDDYLNDIVGTQYLRNMNYSKAVEYLSAVSSSYNKGHLNTYIYYNPFSLVKCDNVQNDGFSSSLSYDFGSECDFKYSFAREMCSLEHSIATVKDPNRKAWLMVRYAIGIRNSFDSCWALTQYYKGCFLSGSVIPIKRDWESDKYTQAATKRYCQIFDSACEIATDKSIAAQIQYDLCNYKTVATKYADTALGQYVKGECDNLYDHHLERRRGM